MGALTGRYIGVYALYIVHFKKKFSIPSSSQVKLYRILPSVYLLAITNTFSFFFYYYNTVNKCSVIQKVQDWSPNSRKKIADLAIQMWFMSSLITCAVKAGHARREVSVNIVFMSQRCFCCIVGKFRTAIFLKLIFVLFHDGNFRLNKMKITI